MIQRNYEEGIERNEWLPEIGGNERLRSREKTPDGYTSINLPTGFPTIQRNL
jgi:hypothetical protein